MLLISLKVDEIYLEIEDYSDFDLFLVVLSSVLWPKAYPCLNLGVDL